MARILVTGGAARVGPESNEGPGVVACFESASAASMTNAAQALQERFGLSDPPALFSAEPSWTQRLVTALCRPRSLRPQTLQAVRTFLPAQASMSG